MGTILSFIIVALSILTIIGLYKPEKVLLWDANPKRYKVLLYCFALMGCLSLVANITGVNDQVQAESQAKKAEELKKQDFLNVGIDSVNALVGKKVPFDKWEEWGNPKTLKGTDNTFWVVYLDKANISFVSRKSDQIVQYAGFKEEGALNYINNYNKERASSINKQFSAFNGSHMKLTELVKKQMKDPDSFKHLETIKSDAGDYLRVKMRYSGTNSFGARIQQTIVAKTDIQSGVILEVVD